MDVVTSPHELGILAATFFDDFVAAFRTFNGHTIAERYLAPYLAFSSPTGAQVFDSANAIGDYFQRVVDEYYSRGVRSCRYTDLAIVPLGRECVLATVTWDLLADDSSIVVSWRESYNLTLHNGRLRVFASTDHAE